MRHGAKWPRVPSVCACGHHKSDSAHVSLIRLSEARVTRQQKLIGTRREGAGKLAAFLSTGSSTGRSRIKCFVH